MKIINRLIWGAAAIAGTVAVIGWVASRGDETPEPPTTAVRAATTAAPTTTTTAPTTTTTTTAPTTTTDIGFLTDLAALFEEWESVQASLEADMARLERLCVAEGVIEEVFWTQGAEAAVEHFEECAGITAGALDTFRRWRPTVQQFTRKWPEIDEGWEMLQIADETIGALETQQEDIDAQVEEGRALLEDLGLG